MKKTGPVHWNTTPIHVIDFEGSRKTGVLEYGVTTLLNGEIQSTHTRLCASDGKIPDGDIRQHGIEETDLKGTQPFDLEWDLFNQFRQSGIFCAHAARVEHQFLKNTWPHPIAAPAWLEAGKTVNNWGPWIDTLELYRAIFPDSESHKLMELINTFSLNTDLEELAKKYCPQARHRPHCALFDSLASALLLLKLGRTPKFEALTIQWLLQHSAASSEARQATQQRELF